MSTVSDQSHETSPVQRHLSRTSSKASSHGGSVSSSPPSRGRQTPLSSSTPASKPGKRKRPESAAAEEESAGEQTMIRDSDSTGGGASPQPSAAPTAPPTSGTDDMPPETPQRKKAASRRQSDATAADSRPQGDHAAAVQSTTGGGGAGGGGTEKEERNVDSLLTPLAKHDWARFMSDFKNGLRAVAEEEAGLFEEYHKWNWIYQLWSTCRAEGDELRLSREMATISQWTIIKEETLERARSEHTENMLAISKVLGIDPKNAVPTPSKNTY